MTSAEGEGRKVPIWRLLLLSTAGGAVDIGYAVGGGYNLPVIRGVGVPLSYATAILAVSPIIGMIFQPFLGAISDQTNCYFGRRKPFIFALSLMAIIGCAAPFSTYLDYIPNINSIFVKVSIFVLVILLDFSIGQLQLPSRAFLLDVLPVSQAQTGNFIYTLVLLIYASAGFFLGSVDWSKLVGESFEIEHQAQVVFGLAAFVIFVSMICTIFSIREDHKYHYSDKDLKHNSTTAKVENSLHGESEQEPLLYKTHTTETVIDDSEKSLSSQSSLEVIPPKACCCCCSNFNVIKFFITCTFDIIKFIYYMSFNMWILCFVTLFGYFGEGSFVLGFTTFVGTVVYDGDPEASQGSIEYEDYACGVRMGSLALGISTIVGWFLSVTLNYITKWIRLKTVFVVVLAGFVVSMFLMILLPKIYYTMIFGLWYGPLLVVLSVVPFSLIPIYEASD